MNKLCLILLYVFLETVYSDTPSNEVNNNNVVQEVINDDDNSNNKNRIFEVDYLNNQFLKDGEPFRFVAGSFHYFRTPRAYWADRMKKMRAAGLNAVTTYIEWSQHEPSPGVYDFTDEKDIVHYIQLAQSEDLLVILRPGPYICAERDFGGYPSWLLSLDMNMKLRTNDTSHTRYILQWLTTLMPILQPYLYGNGGPVIMVQVENEYGSYSACDKNYTTWLRDVFHSYVGRNAVLFTTDGYLTSYFKCGPIPGILTTVDFGTGINVTEAFWPLRRHQPYGPLVNSEFYPGWLTHWSEKIASVNTSSVIKTLKDLLDANASVNIYIFVGGTNFGFTSGANLVPQYVPDITSYDYDAPITESGDLTEKYHAIKQLLEAYLPVPRTYISPAEPKGDYGRVTLWPKISLFNTPPEIDPVTSTYPLTFEALNQSFGFLLYETKLEGKYSDPAIISVPGLHDRAIIYLNKRAVGILSRTQEITSMPLMVQTGQKLHLLVENQGRVNYGEFKDPKGILSNVTLSNEDLLNWTIYSYPLNNISIIEDLPELQDRINIIPPAFYTGRFTIPKNTTGPLDTFINMDGWGKGVVFVNQFNLGRYWPSTGPQITLYVPGCYLHAYPEKNIVTVFELEYVRPDYTVTFVSYPILNGTTPPSS